MLLTQSINMIEMSPSSRTFIRPELWILKLFPRCNGFSANLVAHCQILMNDRV